MDRRQALQRIALLTGGALSFSTVSAVLGGCRLSTDDEYVPTVLVDDLNEFVATVADILIPETDTPGAREARVHHFIDQTLAEWMTREEREHFLNQVEAFREQVRQEFERNFVDVDQEDQVRLLEEAQDLAYNGEDEVLEIEMLTAWRDGEDPEFEFVPGTGQREYLEVNLQPWFRTMKELTFVGYYTSEIGATQELRYVHVPGRYEPCMPFEELGRAWA